MFYSVADKYYVEKKLSTKWLHHEAHTCEHIIYMHPCILLLAQECFCIAQIYASIMLANIMHDILGVTKHIKAVDKQTGRPL